MVTQPIVNTAMLPHPKIVPIHKWEIKFSGQTHKESLMAFLEQVQDLCESRNISEQDLFVSAGDLFCDATLLWYRNIKKDVHSWPELVESLKRDFLLLDCEQDLLKEIRERTQ